METQKELKWSNPDYKREYFRKYYHKTKVLKNNGKNIDWTDPEAVRKYHKEIYLKKKENQVIYICEVCRCKTFDKVKHEKTQRHKNALAILEKLKLLNTIQEISMQT